MRDFLRGVLDTWLVILIIFGLNLAYEDLTEKKSVPQKIDLPEEYKLITNKTPIQGYFSKDSILHIEFKHSKIKTEYTIELIDQDSIKIYSVSNDTIYKCLYTEMEQVIELDNL